MLCCKEKFQPDPEKNYCRVYYQFGQVSGNPFGRVSTVLNNIKRRKFLVTLQHTHFRSSIGYVPLGKLKGSIITEEYAALILYEDEDCDKNQHYHSSFRPSYPNPYVQEIRYFLSLCFYQRVYYMCIFLRSNTFQKVNTQKLVVS